jgi:hypothetical protein
MEIASSSRLKQTTLKSLTPNELLQKHHGIDRSAQMQSFDRMSCLLSSRLAGSVSDSCRSRSRIADRILTGDYHYPAREFPARFAWMSRQAGNSTLGFVERASHPLAGGNARTPTFLKRSATHEFLEFICTGHLQQPFPSSFGRHPLIEKLPSQLAHVLDPIAPFRAKLFFQFATQTGSERRALPVSRDSDLQRPPAHDRRVEEIAVHGVVYGVAKHPTSIAGTENGFIDDRRVGSGNHEKGAVHIPGREFAATPNDLPLPDQFLDSMYGSRTHDLNLCPVDEQPGYLIGSNFACSDDQALAACKPNQHREEIGGVAQATVASGVHGIATVFCGPLCLLF